MLKPEVPIDDAEGWGAWEGEGVKRQCCLHFSVSQNQWINGDPSTKYPLQLHFSGETLHRSIQFKSVSPCVFVETVIHGHVSPGLAGSAHWIKSSSGGQPESLPSLSIH